MPPAASSPTARRARMLPSTTSTMRPAVHRAPPAGGGVVACASVVIRILPFDWEVSAALEGILGAPVRLGRREDEPSRISSDSLGAGNQNGGLGGRSRQTPHASNDRAPPLKIQPGSLFGPELLHLARSLRDVALSHAARFFACDGNTSLETPRLLCAKASFPEADRPGCGRQDQLDSPLVPARDALHVVIEPLLGGSPKCDRIPLCALQEGGERLLHRFRSGFRSTRRPCGASRAELCHWR